MHYYYEKEMSEFYGRFKKIIAPSSVSWPLGYFEVSKELMSEWTKDILQIQKLIKKLPEILNVTDFKAQYHLTEELHEAYQAVNQSLDSCFRPDCVLTNSGLKVLEFNIDPGAMMVQTGVSPREILLAYLHSTKKNVHYLDQVRESYAAENKWVEFLRKSSIGKNVVFWDIPRDPDNLGIRKQIESVLLNAGFPVEFISGDEILKLQDMDNLKIFRVFSYPHLQTNKLMHSIFLKLHSEQKNQLGVRNLIFDSKLNFAILWSLKVSKKLNDVESDLVTKYIPETYILNEKIYSEESKADLLDKDMWVLKAINGFQGNEIYLGKEVMGEDWGALLEKHMVSGNFILQRMQQSKKFNIRWLGSDEPTLAESHLLNLFFIDSEFVGSVCRVTSSGVLKVGAVDNKQTYALPLLIGDDIVS